MMMFSPVRNIQDSPFKSVNIWPGHPAEFKAYGTSLDGPEAQGESARRNQGLRTVESCAQNASETIEPIGSRTRNTRHAQ